MEQAEETAPEPRSQGNGAFRLVGERRVVKLQLFQGVSESEVLLAVCGIESGEDHRLEGAIGRKSLGSGVVGEGDGVPHGGVAYGLQTSGNVPDLPGFESVRLDRVGAEVAKLQRLALLAVRHDADTTVRKNLPVADPDIRHHSLVAVVLGVEDQRAEGSVAFTRWRGNALDNGIQQSRHARAGLSRHEEKLLSLETERLHHLLGNALRLRSVEIDLVNHRNDLKVILKGQVHVRQGLRLDALRGVYDEQSALARGQAPRHLVGEVDVAGRVD